MKQKEVSKHHLYICWCIGILVWICLHNIWGHIYYSLAGGLFFCVYMMFYSRKIRFLLYYLFFWFFWYMTWIIISDIDLAHIHEKKEYISSVQHQPHHTLRILDTYKIKEYSKQYTVQLEKSDIYGLITVPFNFALQKWDLISTTSEIKSIINISEDFKYAEYMQTKNIFFQAYLPHFNRISYEPPNAIIWYIGKVRQKSLDIIHTLYPKEEAIFLWGILIGARESLPKELQTHFNNSGLTHFIAVSGFNITILIIFLATLSKYLPPMVQIIVVIGGIILFTFLVWETAPVIRASIMWSLGYLCLTFWRNSNVTSLILTTAVIMVAYNPSSINYDVSLHLSFLAVIGIVLLQGWYKKIFSWVPRLFALQEAVVLTFAALTTTLPIMLINFWQVSLLSPLSNILVTWTIPIAMLWGFLSLIWSLLLPPLAWVFWFVTYILLRWDIAVVHTIGAWEYSVVWYDTWIYGHIFLLFYFWVLWFVVLYFHRKNKEHL